MQALLQKDPVFVSRSPPASTTPDLEEEYLQTGILLEEGPGVHQPKGMCTHADAYTLLPAKSECQRLVVTRRTRQAR